MMKFDIFIVSSIVECFYVQHCCIYQCLILFQHCSFLQIQVFNDLSALLLIVYCIYQFSMSVSTFLFILLNLFRVAKNIMGSLVNVSSTRPKLLSFLYEGLICNSLISTISTVQHNNKFNAL